MVPQESTFYAILSPSAAAPTTQPRALNSNAAYHHRIQTKASVPPSPRDPPTFLPSDTVNHFASFSDQEPKVSQN